MSDATNTILNNARDQLVDRRDKIEPFIAEHRAAVDAIKVIDKALGKPTPQQRALPSGQGTGQSPRAAFTERVITILRTNGAMTIEVLADALSREPDSYLRSILTNAVIQGVISYDETDGDYSVQPA